MKQHEQPHFQLDSEARRALRNWLLRVLVGALLAAAFFWLQLHFLSKSDYNDDLDDLQQTLAEHDDTIQAQLNDMNNWLNAISNDLEPPPEPTPKVITRTKKGPVRYRVIKQKSLLERMFSSPRKRRR